jgi:hypothetical protein
MSLYKNIIGCSLLLLMLAACTKEGLPGPEGEPGPAGEDATGGGGGGSRNVVISYTTPSNAVFTWEKVTGTMYKLKYTLPSHSGNTFTLPDSVTKYIDEGALLVYAAEKSYDGEQSWYQLQAETPLFYTVSTFAYTIEKVTGTGYRFTVISTEEPHIDYDRIRFVIAPKTTSQTFGN